MPKQINLTDEEVIFLKNTVYGYPVGKKIINKLNKKRIKTSSAKAKGRDLQKWVCSKLAGLIGIEYNQSDDQCEIHSREMGQKGVDIILRGRAKELLPLSIECKNTEKLSLNETIQQAKKNQELDNYWVVVHKNRTLKDPVVIIDWGFFEFLLSLSSFKSFYFKKGQNE